MKSPQQYWLMKWVYKDIRSNSVHALHAGRRALPVERDVIHPKKHVSTRVNPHAATNLRVMSPVMAIRVLPPVRHATQHVCVRARVPVMETRVLIRVNPPVKAPRVLPRAGKHVTPVVIHGNLHVEIHARIRVNPPVVVLHAVRHAILAMIRVKHVKRVMVDNSHFFHFSFKFKKY
jgi:hypothetical protein